MLDSRRDYTGRVLGSWHLVRPLGKGASGVVYEARHKVIPGRLAAVKLLHPHLAQDPESRRRFLNEATAVSRADHENIVQIFDGGVTDDGLCYVVMELLTGRSLAELLRAGPLDVPRTLNVAAQVTAALAAAHGLGIVHRDLKPQNVMLCQRPGQGELVKVVDFGIARALEPDQRMTMVGAVLGTPDYMSPEQARGAGDVDARSDVFSLGLLTCRMLSGSIPFSGTGRTPIEQIVARAMLREPPPPLRQLRPDLSPALEAALLRALEPDPQRRTPTARQFAEELEAAARS